MQGAWDHLACSFPLSTSLLYLPHCRVCVALWYTHSQAAFPSFSQP